MDNATLIRFFKGNLPPLLKNKYFDLDIVSFSEEKDLARWTIHVSRNDVAFDVVLEYFPEVDWVVLYPVDDSVHSQRFSDKHEITTRIELLYFNKRFDNFLPLQLDEATRNKLIFRNVVRVCRFVEDRFLEGRLKKCNVVWNDTSLLCEFMFEGNIRGIEHNSWFLSLEYYPQLERPEELFLISYDGINADDEGMEQEAKNLNDAFRIIETQLQALPE